MNALLSQQFSIQGPCHGILSLREEDLWSPRDEFYPASAFCGSTKELS